MPLIDGSLYYSSIGIVQVVEHFKREETQMVKICVHQVQPNDGVTPNGSYTVRSMSESDVEALIGQFPRDMEQRKNANEQLKRLPEYQKEAEKTLESIDKALKDKMPQVQLREIAKGN